MAVANSRAIRSTNPQLRDQEFFVTLPGDPRLAVTSQDEELVRWEGGAPGPVFLVIGRRAMADELEPLCKRWSLSIVEVVSALSDLLSPREDGSVVKRQASLASGFFYVLDHSVDKTGTLVRVVSTHLYTTEGLEEAHEQSRKDFHNGKFTGVYGVQPIDDVPGYVRRAA